MLLSQPSLSCDKDSENTSTACSADTPLEEASVKTLGNSAEVPSRGVNLVAIVKSGSNEFHSTASYNKTGPNFQSDNIDDDLRSQGITNTQTMDDRWSLSGDLGGRSIKDSQWF